MNVFSERRAHFFVSCRRCGTPRIPEISGILGVPGFSSLLTLGVSPMFNPKLHHNFNQSIKMDKYDLKFILTFLYCTNEDIYRFFREENNKITKEKNITKLDQKTIETALTKQDGSFKSNTEKFFKHYIKNWQKNEDHLSVELHPDLIDCLKRQSQNNYSIKSEPGQKEELIINISSAEKLLTEKFSKNDLNNSNYIGKLQDEQLPFHDAVNQKKFWSKIHKIITTINPKRNFQYITHNSDKNQKFNLSFIKIEPINPSNHLNVECTLIGEEEPLGADESEFTSMAKKGPNAHDNPSFGLCGYEINGDNLNIHLRWTTYFRSLRMHDSFFMSAIYACGGSDEDKTMSAVANTVNTVLRNTGKLSKPILGVTTAVVFKREEPEMDRFWTFVQLKEGGASRIAESHLTPSFVHQPATKMRRSLRDEVSDIEFHIYRELIEEIFNFPEQVHSDFSVYKKIVYGHFAIKSIQKLIENKEAELIFDGLVFDVHRAKYELTYVLRIDNTSWFDEAAEFMQGNYEAIKTGVVLAPLDANGVFEILNGRLTYGKPIRRLCAPGQAGLIAAVTHLKNRGDKYLKDIRIESGSC